jgi:pre-mRNA-splicing factor CWC26
MGMHAETVFRDKSGRRVDIRAEMARKQDERSAAVAAAAATAYDVGVGAVQKQEAVTAAAELAKAAAAPLARYAGDRDLETHLKSQLREGDPMAAFLSAQALAGSAAASSSSGGAAGGASAAGAGGKPRYKGPPAPPNRYGIQPGYRWDGIVRGTGWESKVLAARSGRSAREERGYHNRVSDM